MKKTNKQRFKVLNQSVYVPEDYTAADFLKYVRVVTPDGKALPILDILPYHERQVLEIAEELVVTDIYKLIKTRSGQRITLNPIVDRELENRYNERERKASENMQVQPSPSGASGDEGDRKSMAKRSQQDDWRENRGL